MPPTSQKHYNCILCCKRTKPKERRTIVNSGLKKILAKSFFLEPKAGEVLCNTCCHKYYKTVHVPSKQASNTPSTSDNDPDYAPPQEPERSKTATISSPPSISLNIKSTSKSHAYCFICKRPGPKLIVISSEARVSAFVDYNIIIPAGCRCCPNHMEDGILSKNVTGILPTTATSFVNRTTILDLLNRMREITKQSQSLKIDFDIGSLTDSDCSNLTGLSKSQFYELCDYVTPHVRNTPARSTRQSVGIFLLKLKSGTSNKLLSTLFNISKSSLRRAISTVRLALMKYFVPLNLGLQHIIREDVITNHTRPLAQSLFGNGTNALLVLDGTNIYIQKSRNFQFQRRSYSMHKGRPLVKPMVVTTTTGYFITVNGPYLADAKNNDASILRHMLQTNVEDIRTWLQEDDVFIVDRGFRDALGFLEELGIKSEMPSFMVRGEKQMSTDDANASRLVTKVRWVVEAANARIKRWKYLDHVLPTNQVPYIGDYVKIVCAISNKFSPPLISADADEDAALASKMRILSANINALKQHVEDNNLERRSAINWQITTEFSDFPHLDEQQLRDITCGSFQLKMSSSYIQEHLDGECDILVHRENHNLLRVKIQSRHVSSRGFLLWIQYNPNAIEAWYCKCRAGARVVGVCSHVAAILWYLGYARHTERRAFGVRDWSGYLEDAKNIPQIIDESDSESGESLVEE